MADMLPLFQNTYKNVHENQHNILLILSSRQARISSQHALLIVTIALELYEDDTMYDSGYNYANSYGTLFGDVQRLKLEIEKLIPDFQNKLKL